MIFRQKWVPFLGTENGPDFWNPLIFVIEGPKIGSTLGSKFGLPFWTQEWPKNKPDM